MFAASQHLHLEALLFRTRFEGLDDFGFTARVDQLGYSGCGYIRGQDSLLRDAPARKVILFLVTSIRVEGNS